MYKRLKFSWAHIVAFLALIFIGYVSFVGLTYMIDDGFEKPALLMLGILLVLTIWFIGAQQLKGVDNNFPYGKCIWWERLFVFTSPIILIVCLIPFNHAFNVAGRSQEIESTFNDAINSSRSMFEDYDVYVQRRITNYQEFLTRVKDNKDIQPTVYSELGFKGDKDNNRINTEVQILRRQLTANYDSLKTEALDWIDRVDQTTSVWNVFLIGNIEEIKSAIVDWRFQMENFSKVILQTERQNVDEKVVPFDVDEKSVNLVMSQLDSLSKIYYDTDNEGINATAVIIGVILFLLLLFPYFLQERDGRSTFTLFGRRYMEDKCGLSLERSKFNSGRSQALVGLTLDEAPQKRTPQREVRTSPTESDINIVMIEDDEEYVSLSREERRKKRQRRRAARLGMQQNDDYEISSTGRKCHKVSKDDDDDVDFSPIDEL